MGINRLCERIFILYFSAFLTTAVYNLASYLMRSIGDSRTPVKILIVAAIINIVLDALFMIPLKLGVFGAGLATVIAQTYSAVIHCRRQTDFLQWEKNDFQFYSQEVPELLRFSVLTAIQQSITTFGMMLVQGIVNTFGSSTIAAFAACTRIEEFATRPLQDLGNATSTFVSQNKGAQQYNRAREGVIVAVRMIAFIAILCSTGVFLLPKQLIHLIIKNPNAETIELGTKYLRIISPFFFFLGVLVVFYGAFRAFGNLKASIFMTVISQAIRFTMALWLSQTSIGFIGIAIAVVSGWVISDILGIVSYRNTVRSVPNQ